MRILLITLVAIIAAPFMSFSCSMYKLTMKGKTIVGNNEDWFSPNSQFWYEPATGDLNGVMYMGQLNNFAQGALNDKGLMFDGFANPYLEVKNSNGKADVSISDAIRKVMQTMSTIEEVRDYMATINLSSLSSSMIVFVDKSGSYLIVEGDELIVGDESEQCFSNFYFSQIESLDDVELDNVKNGLAHMNETKAKVSLDYGGDMMNSLSSIDDLTQYTTIYDLDKLTIRVYLFHDYSQFVEFTLDEKLKIGEHKEMIADLFPKDSPGYKNYLAYNDPERPTQFLENLVGEEKPTENEFIEMGFDGIINTIGYEWLDGKDDAPGAIKIFKYGIEKMPNNSNLYDSLGEAYFRNENYALSVKNYSKSLELDPENKNAEEMIERIEKM